MEAARLYGLERIKEGSTGKYEYYLGGIPVVDLATMNCRLSHGSFNYILTPLQHQRQR
jgi:hypothetical protein